MKLIIRWYRTTVSHFTLATILNILGLSAAFAAFILIFGRVTDELGYDKFHKDAERIYRIEARDNEADENIPNLARRSSKKTSMLPPRVASKSVIPSG